MAKSMPRSKVTPMGPPRTFSTFNVTQVIGTVSLDEHGELPPDLAAYQLIHTHDMPGTYTFPNIYGGDTTVIIAVPPENPGADIDNYADMDD